jgi:hypothetical protein
VRWIAAMGATPYWTREDVGASGVWHRVYAGAHRDRAVAAQEAARLDQAAPGLHPEVVELVSPDDGGSPSGTGSATR